MGARCWDCGVKVGRCYEHGTSDCSCVSCGCETLRDEEVLVITKSDMALLGLVGRPCGPDVSPDVLNDGDS